MIPAKTLRRVAKLLDAYADELRSGDALESRLTGDWEWEPSPIGRASKRRHNELRALALALNIEAKEQAAAANAALKTIAAGMKRKNTQA